MPRKSQSPSSPISRKVAVFGPPEYVYSVRKKLATGEIKTYWYHQPGRNAPDKADRGKRTRLPDPNSPEWFAALADLGAVKPSAKPSAMTVDALWQSYRASPAWPKNINTQRVYESRYRVHIQPSFGARLVSEITAPAIAELRDSRAAVPATANMVIVVLSLMWDRAVETGKAASNIARGVRRLDENPDEAKPLTPEAWAALISDAAPEALRRFAYLARGTGQRISDVVTMTPAMREDEGIRHAIKKTGKKRNIESHWSPIRAEYLTVIDSWKTWPSRRYLQLGKQPVDEHAIRHLWRKLALSEDGKALRGFTPHDLRASCICDDRLDGYTELEISSRRAMSTVMVQKYSRYIDQKKAAMAREKSRDSA